MKDVIVIFDIGKTNKKLFLFDQKLNIVYENITHFDEISDDDGYPCDDIEAIEKWIYKQIDHIQEQGVFKIKAINFSTHGATVVYLDENGKRVTPLYNYLKPLDDFDFSGFYEKYGGVDEFSRKTASPAYGMLNSGLQIYWLKNAKPHYWKKVKSILHYPQYLSYLFTKKILSEYTSIGCHTAMWDFDRMQYHSWLKQEKIYVPDPENGDPISFIKLGNDTIAIGAGLHDSSASLLPLLEKNHENEFILLSTGTWILSMNPFSEDKLTQNELKNNCLCFLTPQKKQVKSSMKFLGYVHEATERELAVSFNKKEGSFTSLQPDKDLCNSIIQRSERIFFPSGLPKDFKADLSRLNSFKNYNEAYSQLMYEISYMVFEGIKLITDKENKLKEIYISGGFSKNSFFRHYLSLLLPDLEIKISRIKNESALGAAMMIRKHLN